MSWNPFENTHPRTYTCTEIAIHYAGIVGCIDKLLLTPWLLQTANAGWWWRWYCAFVEHHTTEWQCNAALCMHVHLCIVSAVQQNSEEKENQIKRRAKEKTQTLRKAHRMRKKKRSTQKRNKTQRIVCVCVWVCSWLRTNNDEISRETSALIQDK